MFPYEASLGVPYTWGKWPEIIKTCRVATQSHRGDNVDVCYNARVGLRLHFGPGGKNAQKCTILKCSCP